jgi:UDP-N-acetylglucosamine 4,6-dehydratase
MKNKTILITGGTGTLGKSLIREIIKREPKKIIVFSRDEYKQSEMQKEFDIPCLRYFIGDIRDYNRLVSVFDGVDCVIHAAALKQVPALEYNPTEAVATNILGSKNVIDAALHCGVKKVIGVSTDKAVNPINLYGSTKLTMEKMFTAANNFNRTKFSCVRYGNVIGSRGSVIELFKSLKEKGIKEFPVTDTSMTRFWIKKEEAVQLVMTAYHNMSGGEIFVPIIPSTSMVEIAKAVDIDCTIKVIGVRAG